MEKERKFFYKGFPIEIRILDMCPPMCEIWYLSECIQLSLISKSFEIDLRDNLKRILTYIDEAEYAELLADKLIDKYINKIEDTSCI